jgi:hypothetical protein
MSVIGEIAVGIVVGIVSAYASARLALRRYRSERWWDKKYDAYIVILNSLHGLLQNVDAYYDEAMSGAETPEDQQTERRRRYREAVSEIERHITLGTFLLHRDTVDALQKLKEGINVARKLDDFVEYLDASDFSYRDALAKIRKVAEKELSGGRRRPS